MRWKGRWRSTGRRLRAGMLIGSLLLPGGCGMLGGGRREPVVLLDGGAVTRLKPGESWTCPTNVAYGFGVTPDGLLYLMGLGPKEE